MNSLASPVIQGQGHVTQGQGHATPAGSYLITGITKSKGEMKYDTKFIYLHSPPNET